MCPSDQNTEIILKIDTELSIFPEFVASMYSFPFPDLRMKYEAIKL